WVGSILVGSGSKDGGDVIANTRIVADIPAGRQPARIDFVATPTLDLMFRQMGTESTMEDDRPDPFLDDGCRPFAPAYEFELPLQPASTPERTHDDGDRVELGIATIHDSLADCLARIKQLPSVPSTNNASDQERPTDRVRVERN